MNEAYDYTDELMRRKLSDKTVIKEFEKITDNSERVKFLMKLIVDEKLLPDYSKLVVKKSNELADKYRNEGNNLYKAGNNYEALVKYNKSLCFAEKEAIGTAFFNKSAVYFTMLKFEISLENIKLARENGYPDQEKLNKRETSCLENLNNKPAKKAPQRSVNSVIKLSHEPKKIPGIAGCLELKESSNFGRFIITNQDLKVGDIVAMEEPFSKILLESQMYERCTNCLKINKLNLIPCTGCTSAMFCSSKCQTDAHQRFHKYECKILAMVQTYYTKIMQIALRTIFEALAVFDGDANALEVFLKEIDGVPQTVFDVADTKGASKNWLHWIDALVTNESHRNSMDLFQRAGICALLFQLIESQATLKSVMTTEQNWDMFRRFLFKQSQCAKINYHGISAITDRLVESGKQEPDNYGSGAYPFCSLINHSCSSNVVRLSMNSRNLVVVNRPIAKGQQLFDNYGYHHCIEGLAYRQRELMAQYVFKCKCDACVNNYPLYHNLKRFDSTFDKFLQDDVHSLRQHNYKTANKKWKAYCDYIQKNDKQYPCYEISTIQNCILGCIHIFIKEDTF